MDKLKYFNASELTRTRSKMDPSSKVKVVEAVERSSRAPWEDDLDDILNILCQPENLDTTSVSQTDLSNELYLFQDSFPALSTLQFYGNQEEMQTQCATGVQGTSRPGITVQSDFPVLPVTEQMEIDKTDSVKASSYAPNANVAGSINQSIDLSSTLISPFFMKPVVFGREPTSLENSFGSTRKKKEGKVQTFGRGETPRQTTSTIQQSPYKLLGILSLILQAFNSHLTAELEECYTGVLQRALAEIQEVTALHNTLIDNKYNKC